MPNLIPPVSIERVDSPTDDPAITDTEQTIGFTGNGDEISVYIWYLFSKEGTIKEPFVSVTINGQHVETAAETAESLSPYKNLVDTLIKGASQVSSETVETVSKMLVNNFQIS